MMLSSRENLLVCLYGTERKKVGVFVVGGGTFESQISLLHGTVGTGCSGCSVVNVFAAENTQHIVRFLVAPLQIEKTVRILNVYEGG